MASPRTSLELAQASEKKGDLAKAADAYQKHLEKNADDRRALLRLAELRERLNQPQAAAEAFRRLGHLHLADGFRGKAASALGRAVKLLPHDMESAVALADLLAEDGKRRDAAEILEGSAAAAEVRGDREGRLELLTRAARLDGGAKASLALASVLTEMGRPDEARERLRHAAGRLRERRATADEVSVLERLLDLSSGDVEVVTQATRGAFLLRDPRRALIFVRRALDHRPDDPYLASLAAEGLEELGEPSAAALVHRSIARRRAREGALAAAREAWREVLRLSPEDEEAHAAFAPSLALDAGKLLERRGQSLEGIAEDEVDGAFAALDAPAPEALALEVSLDDLKGLTIEADPVLPAPEPEDADALVVADEQEASLEAPPGHPERTDLESKDAFLEPPEAPPGPLEPAEALRPGLAQAPSPAAIPAAPQPALPEEPALPVRPFERAMVLGNEPEAGWAAQALSDLGLDVLTVTTDELGGAVDRGLETERDLVVAPSSLAAALREASDRWKVLAPASVDQALALDFARGAGLAAIEAMPIRSAADLGRAIEALGTPLLLCGPSGTPLEVARGAAPAYQMALARQRFHGEIVAQRPVTERVSVLIAADRKGAIVLGEWKERALEGKPIVQSPAGEGEPERRELAHRVALALKLRGLAVITLSKAGASWAFEAVDGHLGAGALGVEVRCGVPLFPLAIELLQGQPLPKDLAPRGFACAARVETKSLSSIASLRIETGLDGHAFVCAHAPDLGQAERRLGRALKI